MKSREVILSSRATEDLRWIYETIADATGPEVARGYVRRIRAFCDRLSYASERGHRRDDIRAGLRIVGFERRVTIAFSVSEERVEILRILYGGVDWENDL
jgi:toxin ParE1/3/4